MGGSLAMALKRARPDWTLVGNDGPDVLEEARKHSVVDETEVDAEKAVGDADVVVLGAPVEAIVEHIGKLASTFRPGSLVTDLGSTKRKVMKAAESLPDEVNFVGGHPMAGKVTSGLRAADPDLFQGAAWALVPGVPNKTAGISELSEIVRAVGGEPITVDATTHDRAVAVVSQLPQILALVLCEQAASVERGTELGGPVFRNLSRLAGSSTAIWNDIFSSNADMLIEAVAELERRLKEARADLAGTGMGSHFEAARKAVAAAVKPSNLDEPDH